MDGPSEEGASSWLAEAEDSDIVAGRKRYFNEKQKTNGTYLKYVTDKSFGRRKNKLSEVCEILKLTVVKNEKRINLL